MSWQCLIWAQSLLGSGHLRRAMLMSKGDPSVFLTRPISLGFIIATVLILVVIVLPAVRSRRGEIAG